MTYPIPNQTEIDADGFRAAVRHVARLAEALGLPDSGLSIGEVIDTAVTRLTDGEALVHARWHRALDDPAAEPPGPIRDHIEAALAAAEGDLRSRIACVLEATSWDRPYDVRMGAIRGMCDLDQNGLTPDPIEEAE